MLIHRNLIMCEKLLGINIDCKLSFDDHIGNLWKKAGAKLNALTSEAQYMNTETIYLPSGLYIDSSQ